MKDKKEKIDNFDGQEPQIVWLFKQSNSKRTTKIFFEATSSYQWHQLILPNKVKKSCEYIITEVYKHSYRGIHIYIHRWLNIIYTAFICLHTLKAPGVYTLADYLHNYSSLYLI